MISAAIAIPFVIFLMILGLVKVSLCNAFPSLKPIPYVVYLIGWPVFVHYVIADDPVKVSGDDMDVFITNAIGAVVISFCYWFVGIIVFLAFLPAELIFSKPNQKIVKYETLYEKMIREKDAERAIQAELRAKLIAEGAVQAAEEKIRKEIKEKKDLEEWNKEVERRGAAFKKALDSYPKELLEYGYLSEKENKEFLGLS